MRKSLLQEVKDIAKVLNKDIQTIDDFIRIENDIPWNWLSEDYKLSKTFIRRFSNKLNWEYLIFNPNYDVESGFFDCFTDKIYLFSINIDEPYNIKDRLCRGLISHMKYMEIGNPSHYRDKKISVKGTIVELTEDKLEMWIKPNIKEV